VSLCVVELNDIDVCVSDGVALRLHSPGYALLGSDSLEIGEAARAKARLNPRQTNSHFWTRLGTDPLPNPAGHARHYADLAFAHLNHLHESANRPEEILFAVPGSFSREQLSILLGVAQRCPFRAVGLVDSAVAAATDVAFSARAIHVDLQLHQSVLTRLSRDAGTVAREAVEVLPGTGWVQLLERWARMLTEGFIRQSRFDPLHTAQSEQQLYDRMPGWLLALQQQSDVQAELVNAGVSHHAKLRANDFVRAAQPLYTQIVDAAHRFGEGAPLLLSHRLAALPRTGDLLTGCIPLREGAVVSGCLQHIDLIRSDEGALRFVTRLPAGASITQGVEPGGGEAAPAAPDPTHVLTAARALRLRAPRLYLRRSDHDGWRLSTDSTAPYSCSIFREGGNWWLLAASDARIELNGKDVETPAPVGTGDRFRIGKGGDAEFHLIAEVDDDGP